MRRQLTFAQVGTSTVSGISGMDGGTSMNVLTGCIPNLAESREHVPDMVMS